MRKAPSVTLAASCARPVVSMKRSLMRVRSASSAEGETAAVAEAEAEAGTSWVRNTQRNIFSNSEAPSEALPSVCAANGCGGGSCT